MKHLPPLKSLHFFLICGQQQSFKLAAQQLNVTQAAVSQQIRTLEGNLQVKLFDRTSKQTVLTEKGRELLPFMQRAFDELTKGITNLTGDSQPNILRISAVHSFTSLWLMPRLMDFQQNNPAFMVQVAPSSELVDFSKQNIDLAIRMGRGGYQNVEEKKILDDDLIFVASPTRLLNIDKNEPKQVFQLPWLEDTSIGLQEAFHAYCVKYAINTDKLLPIMQTNNALPLIENAVQGHGFLLVNRSLVIEHLRAGRLVTLLNYSAKSPYALYLVAPEQQFTWKKVQVFEQWLLPKIKESFDDL
jgi:LysR family glycine cleavage system transcriptional activator